jgi:aminoglycoside 3-N-acetyltransferase
MVHSSWRANNGFRGTPADMIRALQLAVGPDGLLVMPSLTYQNKSSREFLETGTPMNVRRSASKMGLLSEVFRRSPGVKRSLSPTHPLLAWGNSASEFVAGHDRALVPFGLGSPFETLYRRDAKILTLDAPFSTITFTHFIEDRIASERALSLYEPDTMIGVVIDLDGERRTVPVKVLADRIQDLRREDRLISEMQARSLLKTVRLGRVRLLMLSCQEAMQCAYALEGRRCGLFDAPNPVRAGSNGPE